MGILTMRHYIFAITAFLSFCGSSAQAAEDKVVYEKTYACISDIAATGLNWNGNQWEPKRFRHFDKFILNVTVIEYISISKEKKKVLHFNLKGDGNEEHCGMEKQFDLTGLQACIQNGMSVIFSEESGRGGVSYLLGAVSKEKARDALVVMPFTCQKF